MLKNQIVLYINDHISSANDRNCINPFLNCKKAKDKRRMIDTILTNFVQSYIIVPFSHQRSEVFYLIKNEFNVLTSPNN